MEEMTAIQFLVALFMSLGGVCMFIWAALSGQFAGVENAKYRAFRTEVVDHDR